MAAAREPLDNDLASINSPWTLSLDVGLAANVPLLDQHDLDNYAYPLAHHLSQATRGPLGPCGAPNGAPTTPSSRWPRPCLCLAGSLLVCVSARALRLRRRRTRSRSEY